MCVLEALTPARTRTSTSNAAQTVGSTRPHTPWHSMVSEKPNPLSLRGASYNPWAYAPLQPKHPMYLEDSIKIQFRFVIQVWNSVVNRRLPMRGIMMSGWAFFHASAFLGMLVFRCFQSCLIIECGSSLVLRKLVSEMKQPHRCNCTASCY